jgi:YaiO family outer membrane protein
VSAAFTVRRYLKGPEHYFSFRVGAGFSPELLNTQTASGVVSKAFYGLQSQTVNLAYQQPLSRRWTANGNITFGRQETLFDVGNYANNLATTVSLRYRYR